ncbi:MAG: MBL fold metallo-hydrolase [Proteobacteria bacterium]|jgi:flavorubredoxin|nr:MBL fold metallo-hydrolase [Pseudomonadota bacterium]
MHPIQVSPRVWWVGALDWAVRNFHGYRTSRGTTYNAYLITGEENILIDTVREPFFDEMLSRISQIIEPSQIDHVISTHAELDHTGAMPQLLEVAKPKSVMASRMGVKALEAHFHWQQQVRPLKDGEKVVLGNTTMHFHDARMLHWPDSMLALFQEEAVLFPNDAFGMHLCTSERFADELPQATLQYEASKYFANILLPFAGQVKKFKPKLMALLPEVKIIAPDHGPVWRQDMAQIVNLYQEWAAQKPLPKAIVAYDTMWQSTAKMARAVAAGLIGAGIKTEAMPLQAVHRSDVAAELMNGGALIVGSPTLNNDMMPTLADLMSYLKGLKFKNKVGAAFGSYGWNGRAVGNLEKLLEGMGVNVVAKGVGVNYVPDGDALQQCVALGEQVAAALKERV